MIVYCSKCKRDTHHIDDCAEGGSTLICDDCGTKFVEEMNRIETLICLHCNRVGEITQSIPLKDRRIVTLSCGHVCTFDQPHQQQETQMTIFNRDPERDQRKCAVCQRPFLTPLVGAWGKICWECRGDFGINTLQEAEEMVQLIESGVLSVTKREGKDTGKVAEIKGKLKQKGAKVDPVVVTEAIRGMTDYMVAPVARYEKPVTYVTAKNGLFEVRHSDLCTIVTKPKEVLGVVEEMKEGWQMNLPRLPFEMLLKTISFFRGVCIRQKGPSEAIVQIWWDRGEKRHTLHVPPQQVSGGGVHHQSTFDQGSEGRWFHVADIHSHGGMGAFWSGTDNNDEVRVSTERLFGVIGKVELPFPEWRWRMRTRDGFIDLNVVDIFDVPQADYNFRVDAKTLFTQLSGKDTFKEGMVNLWCPVDPFKSVEVPEEWYEQVKGYRYSHHGPRNYPQSMKGFIYIDGAEYEVAENNLKATGHKLLKAGEKGV